jgi:hypothetical protein
MHDNMRGVGDRSVPGPDPRLRLASLAALVTSTLIILGCMSFSLGGRTYQCQSTACHLADDGLWTEKGETHLKVHGEQDVYYPVPFATTPNVELTSDFEHCAIVEQKPDHFRIRNTSGSVVTANWQARGVRTQTASAGAAVQATAAPPIILPTSTEAKAD